MGLPGAVKKTIQKNFYSKKIFKLIKNWEFFHIFFRTNSWNKFNCLRIFKKIQKVIKYLPFMLNYNFSYTQLAFTFVPQKDSYYIHNDAELFFLSSSERFWYLPWAFFCLLSFSFSETFWYLSLASFQSVFDNSYL